jgi:ABC-type amino acid transport substrate-binding protein
MAPTASPSPRPIIVATDASTRPYTFLDPERAAIRGFDVDVMTAVAAEARLTIIRWVNVAPDMLLGGLQRKAYDLAIAGLNPALVQAPGITFTIPYLTYGQVLVVPSASPITSVDTLPRGARLGAQLGSLAEAEARRLSQHLGGQSIGYDDLVIALYGLSRGEVDAIIGEGPQVTDELARRQMPLKVAGQPLTQEHLAIALRVDDVDLLQRLNMAIARLRQNGSLAAIARAWHIP